MPKGPRGQRRKADLNQRALQVVRIATGEDIDALPNPGGQPGGRVGGRIRAEGLSAEKRKEIAQKAARTRWSDKTKT